MTVDLVHFREYIKTEAERLGFTHMGIAPAIPAPHYQQYRNWIRDGLHADMDYLSRTNAVKKRGDPQQVLKGCKCIISLTMPYPHPQCSLSDAPSGMGRVSAYARSRDYHEIIWEKLAVLEDAIRGRAKEEVQLKSYVDTGPILEQAYASLAGVGVPGKNSCLLIRGAGSFFFLAEILTDLELPVDSPFTSDLCGSCQRCIEACPTQCILPNRTIDASRCISYLTIENKKEIPDDLKGKINPWVFGCDVCQIVCPHNHPSLMQDNKAGETLLPEFLDLIELISEDDAAFSKRFGQTPLSRAKRTGILRNAVIVLGSQKCHSALPVLKRTLEQEAHPAVQDACRWAINEINQVSSSNPTNDE